MCEQGTLHGTGLIDSLQLFPVFMLPHLGFKFLGGEYLLGRVSVLIVGKADYIIDRPTKITQNSEGEEVSFWVGKDRCPFNHFSKLLHLVL